MQQWWFEAKISLLVFLYDFPSLLTISLALVNMHLPTCISAYGMKGVFLSFDLVIFIAAEK